MSRKKHFNREARNPVSQGAHDFRGLMAQADQHYLAHRYGEASRDYQRALALKPNDALVHYRLGSAMAKQSRTEEAVAHYERAIALEPGSADAHSDLGTALMALGRFDEAMAHFNRAIEVDPGHASAHYSRAEIRTFRADDEGLAALEALAARKDLPAEKALMFHFALAKALDDVGEYGRSFEHLRLGNALKRGLVSYDEPAALNSFREIAATFDRSIFESTDEEGDPSEVPIFVVGMPRSGSTLIEQILSSHPLIYGAGELDDFRMVSSNPEAESLRAIARSYLDRLPIPPNGEIRIVDKQLSNFLLIGTIRLVFPNARIVHTIRDPLDTCLSCYSKVFATAHPFIYDLAELGRYYRCYTELMAHWRSALPPGSVLDVVYENVVDDLEGQARRLIEYCGVPWDERCLSFHTNKRTVSTSSLAQVRRPLFRSSLQRWRKYEAYLGPLLRELGDLVPAEVHS